VFVAGLVVYLRRGDAPDATAGAGDTVLVRKRDGTPWFYVDARPVSAAAFRQVFADHTQPAGPGGAVVMVSYTQARSYAQTRGGRLLSGDEWDSAVNTPGVQPGELLEWIESPDANNRTVRQRGKTAVRPDDAQPDVTFRMAKLPPGT
jgi:formylglycine-generating enzyme required for sulfatase activity